MAEGRVDEALGRECERFTAYLVGEAASERVLDAYTRAHAAGVVDPSGGVTAFDRALVRFAGHGSFCARAADAHGRVFAPGGLLRRKLVLLVAILETDPRGRPLVDTVSARSGAGLLAALFLGGVSFALLLFGFLPVFVVLRAACALRGEGGVEERA
jgi:hypothetical protein